MINKSEFRKQLLSSGKLQISCVVPIYNEANGIINFLTALIATLKHSSDNLQIIVVDDGSTDNAAELVKNCNLLGVELIKFSRNFGKELALTAGLEHATGDVALLIDADFQHPLELIDTFLQNWSQGFDMVYGIQHNRVHESLLKKILKKTFYKIMDYITSEKLIANAGDFRILDKSVVKAINSCKENNRYMKGIYSWVGFSSKGIEFTAKARAYGKSSLDFGKLADLAITGITAFSDAPLRMWSLIGLIISSLSFLYATIIIAKTLIFGVDLPGYASLIVAIMFLSGVQLLSIGILGEYIAKIFNEVKNRPKYIVSEKFKIKEDLN